MRINRSIFDFCCQLEVSFFCVLNTKLKGYISVTANKYDNFLNFVQVVYVARLKFLIVCQESNIMLRIIH
jgi:hypothetical protein